MFYDKQYDRLYYVETESTFSPVQIAVGFITPQHPTPTILLRTQIIRDGCEPTQLSVQGDNLFLFSSRCDSLYIMSYNMETEGLRCRRLKETLYDCIQNGDQILCRMSIQIVLLNANLQKVWGIVTHDQNIEKYFNLKCISERLDENTYVFSDNFPAATIKFVRLQNGEFTVEDSGIPVKDVSFARLSNNSFAVVKKDGTADIYLHEVIKGKIACDRVPLQSPLRHRIPWFKL
uniref:MMS1_N domain-containing protein n=3 Tax=Bursaphelenchus xylophilus TaxID=6326 RepID=A0A1I7SI90_BURXY